MSKTNTNFDLILSLGGGPPGDPGVAGIQGVPGGQGIQGNIGPDGQDGSKWYVQTGPPVSVSPIPNTGDHWFDTVNLNVYEWNGTSWISIGTLSTASMFEDSGINDEIIFKLGTAPNRLTLSSIDAPPIHPAKTGPYKLKLVGPPGNPLMSFGVEFPTGTENAPSSQSYISLTNDGVFNLFNPVEDIILNAGGTSLKIDKQSGVVSKYEFNSTAFQVQLSSADRVLGFAPALPTPTGLLKLHIGLNDALTVTTSRFFTVSDNGTLAIGDAYNNPVSGDSGDFFKLDQINGQLGTTGSTFKKWLRLRGLDSGSNYDVLQVRQIRTFTDTTAVNPWRSVETRIESLVNATNKHFISFHGGALNSAKTDRAALRFGYGGLVNDGYYFGADANGRIGLGTGTFIRNYNDTSGAPPLLSWPTRLNIEAKIGTGSDTAFAGLHFYQDSTDPSAFVNSGITTGGWQRPSKTHAGLIFLNEGVSGVSVNLMSSDYTTLPLGQKRRLTVSPEGELFFWGADNNFSTKTHWFNIKVNANITKMDSYDWGTANRWRNLILMSGTNGSTDTGTGIMGGGFVGIGDFTNFIDNPQTKFHVHGHATFGTRLPITNYGTDTGYGTPTNPLSNWTFGINHKADAANTVIVGGESNKILAGTSGSYNSVIVGGATNEIKNSMYSIILSGDDNKIHDSFSARILAGNSHTISGGSNYSTIIGGIGHVISGANHSIIMGYNGTSGVTLTGAAQANMIVLATNTGVGGAPSSKLDVHGSFATELVKPRSSGPLGEAGVYYLEPSFTGTLTFPTASTCRRRRYRITNIKDVSVTITNSSYINLLNLAVTSIAPHTAIEIISDGTDWRQIGGPESEPWINNTTLTITSSPTFAVTAKLRYKIIGKTFHFYLDLSGTTAAGMGSVIQTSLAPIRVTHDGGTYSIQGVGNVTDAGTVTPMTWEIHSSSQIIQIVKFDVLPFSSSTPIYIRLTGTFDIL